ncbi:MAG: restriction endonuclease [Armatimonadetes bacterium]|nr:restriction endonuclease [Armatimonadota bacterium]
MNQQATQTLKGELLSLSFHAYEECVRLLLVSMGYTDVQLMGCRVRSRKTTHGGLDVQAYTEVGVTRLSIVAQVKQYAERVPRRFVDELRGAMLRTGARQGILITTSTFSRAARKAVAADRTAPIRLIEGDELTQLLIQNRIGAITEAANEPVLDEAYFDALRQMYPKRPRGSPRKQEGAMSLPENPTVGDVISLPVTQPLGGHMMARTHVLIGLSALWGVSLIPHAVTADNVPLLAAATAFGALLPDLDAVESKIKSLSIKGIQPFAPFANSANKAWGHRGFLHSIPALGVLAGGLIPFAFVVDWQIPLTLWLGYASHLMADACTRTGIPGTPFTKRLFLLPYKWRILTGSSAEEALFPFLAASALFFFLRFLYTR